MVDLSAYYRHKFTSKELRPGEAIGFPAGTGIAHTFINNSNGDAVLLVVGECKRIDNKVNYPLHPKRNEEIGEAFWKDSPAQVMGTHDVKPDRLREMEQDKNNK